MSSTTTALLGLYKETPGSQEPADMSKYNANFDTLDNAVTLAGSQTLTNKTLTSPTLTTPTATNPVLNGAVTGTAGFSAWTDFTPTLTQLGAVTFTTLACSYAKVGRIAHLNIILQITGAGTGNNPIAIGAIPAAIAPLATSTFGTFLVVDTSTGYYHGATVFATSAIFNLIVHGAVINSLVGLTPNFALANGDFIHVVATYPTAS